MIDAQIASLVQGIRVASLDSLFSGLSFSIFIVIGAAAAFYVYRKNIHELLQIFIGTGAVFLLSELVKRIWLRARPDSSDSFSFISRHTAFAFFIAFYLPVDKKWKAVLYAWAALVAFSRLWLNLHWFTDVVFGAGLGVVIAFLIKSKMFKEMIKKLKIKEKLKSERVWG